MMSWTRPSILTFSALVALAVIVLAAGFLMPELRRRFVFAPEQAGAEAAVAKIAAGEKAIYRKTGNFAVFTAAEGPARSRMLGLNWNSLPTDDFQFDAALLPDSHLRLRALPRGDTVRALKAPAQIYAAELSPRGDMLRSGWLP
jgi:hypothetical protein